MALTAINSQAQDSDKNIFNHVAVGLSLGTTGIGIDAAAPIGNYVQLRAGVDVFPTIKVNTDLDITPPQVPGYNVPSSIEVQGKTGFTNGKILVDVYPFKNLPLHFTAGAYFGSSEIVKAYNREDGSLIDISRYNNAVEAGLIPNGEKIGVELGDYLLEPDDNGNVNAKIKTSGFKPYLGLGWGRAVPKKRIGFMFDLGVQFWGSPKVYCFDKELSSEDTKGEDGGLIKTLSKVSVYPVLNFRICGRII